MQSKAATVQAYLASLPEDRRAELAALRKVILDNLDDDYQEGMQYGIIGYAVPHSVFPAGYHCDPKQPLPYMGLASQKNHMSLYMMCLYEGGSINPHTAWFQKAWAKTGKKLDMGKACIRFKKLDDLALDVIAESIRRTPTKTYIARYEASLEMIRNRTTKGPPKAAKTASTKKKPISKSIVSKPTKVRKAKSKPRTR